LKNNRLRSGYLEESTDGGSQIQEEEEAFSKLPLRESDEAKGQRLKA